MPAHDPPHRKRCRRMNTPGQAHYLTFSCYKRQPFLARDRTRQWFIQALDLSRSKHAFDLWAYVIMPEHAHVILFPTRDDYSISAILATLKLSVTRKALMYVQTHAPGFLSRMADDRMDGSVNYRFWQTGGGYDRNLISSQEIWEKIEYLHNNPVNRNLSSRGDEWLWSSAADYSGLRKGPIKLNLDSLPRRV